MSSKNSPKTDVLDRGTSPPPTEVDQQLTTQDHMMTALEGESGMTTRNKFQGILLALLMIMRQMRGSGIETVLPLFIGLTPEKGWTIADLGIMFSVMNLGRLLSPIAFTCVANTNSVVALMVLHYSLFLIATAGCLVMIAHNTVASHLPALPMYAVGMGCVGFATDKANVEALIPEIVTSNMKHQTRHAMWSSQGSIVGILLTFVVFATVFDVFGFIATCFLTIGLSALCTICLTILLAISWTDAPIRNRVDLPKEEEGKTAELMSNKTTDNKPDPIEHEPLTSILSPSLYAVELLFVIFLTCELVMEFVSPIVLVQKFHIPVYLIGLSRTCAGGLAFLTLAAASSPTLSCVNFSYPYDMAFVCIVFAAGMMLFAGMGTFIQISFLSLGGFAASQFATTAFRGFEAPAKLLLSPPHAIKQIIGYSNVASRPVAMVGSIVLPYMIIWSVQYSVLMWIAIVLLDGIWIVYLKTTRHRLLLRKLYVPETEKSGNNLPQSEINRLIAERTKVVKLSYLEMEQVGYTGTTYDLSPEVEEELTKLQSREIDLSVLASTLQRAPSFPVALNQSLTANAMRPPVLLMAAAGGMSFSAFSMRQISRGVSDFAYFGEDEVEFTENRKSVTDIVNKSGDGNKFLNAAVAAITYQNEISQTVGSDYLYHIVGAAHEFDDTGVRLSAMNNHGRTRSAILFRPSSIKANGFVGRTLSPIMSDPMSPTLNESGDIDLAATL